MAHRREHTTRIQDLARLHRGDTLEARRYGTVRYRGVVDDVVPHLDVLWLRHGPWQERTLLEAAEYELWKVTESHLPFLHVP
ncbi:hypothetical protein [Kocuria rosea]|uniref:hypothetical protein n=1 Tax=Kocuria rosea TaxID=1275 RepID=UPI0025B7A390|nr:hypothetical protein [Kocuria rosea]WJZ66361.1 hypothetical protein QR564_16710 [Kocuria rosea]